MLADVQVLELLQSPGVGLLGQPVQHPLRVLRDRLDTSQVDLGQVPLHQQSQVIRLGLCQLRALERRQHLTRFHLIADLLEYLPHHARHPRRDMRHAIGIEPHLTRQPQRPRQRPRRCRSHLDVELLDLPRREMHQALVFVVVMVVMPLVCLVLIGLDVPGMIVPGMVIVIIVVIGRSVPAPADPHRRRRDGTYCHSPSVLGIHVDIPGKRF